MILWCSRAVLMLLLLPGTVTVQAATNPRWATTVTQSPVSVQEGRVVTFSAELQVLQGPVSKLEVIGGVGKKKLYRQTFQKLDKNHRQVVSFRWKAIKGTHRVYFSIDPRNQSPDSQTDDNRVELSVNVGALAKAAKPATAGVAGSRTKARGAAPAPGSALPDIVVAEAYAVNLTRQGSRKFYQNDRIQLVIKFANMGQAPTGPFWVKVREDRQVAAGGGGVNRSDRELKKSVPSIEPGKAKQIVIDIGVEHDKHVVYQWWIYADYNNRVAEFRESTREDKLVQIDVLPFK